MIFLGEREKFQLDTSRTIVWQKRGMCVCDLRSPPAQVSHISFSFLLSPPFRKWSIAPISSHQKKRRAREEERTTTLLFPSSCASWVPYPSVRPGTRKREGAIDRRRRRRSNKVGPKLGMGGFFGGGRCTHTTGLYLYLERSSSQKYIGSPPLIHRFPLFLKCP